MKKYTVNAVTSEEDTDNFIQFYKENCKVWISIGFMEERGFTEEEIMELIDKLNECIRG